MSEIKLEFLGPQGLNPFIIHDSSPRSVMFGSHFVQRQALLHPEKKKVRTGLETEFGKYVDMIKMGDNAHICKVIEKYPKTIFNDTPFSPETCVIYETLKDDTIVINCVLVKKFGSNHSKFGYPFEPVVDLKALTKGTYIPKDTVLAKPLSLLDDGSYGYGVNPNVALMSHPGVSEDGFIVSQEFINTLEFTLYEKRVITIDKNTIPLNIYGNNDVYKPIPDLNEIVRGDGLLFASRVKNDDMLPVDVSNKKLQDHCDIFDHKIYVKPGSRIVDIDVVKGTNPNQVIPGRMSEIFDKYAEAKLAYYRDIKETVRQIEKELTHKFNEVKISLGVELHKKLTEAEAIISSRDKKSKIELTYRTAPVSEYRIEVTVMTVMTPNLGFKITDSHGGKGVICSILPRSHMPVDKDGNVADVIMDPSSTVHRMNIGRTYELYITGLVRDIEKRVKKTIGLSPSASHHEIKKQIKNMDIKMLDDIYVYILKLYEIINKEQYDFFNSLNLDDRKRHLIELLTDGLYVHYKTDTDKKITDTITELESFFSPTYDTVSFTNTAGVRVETKYPIRIGKLYLMVLDKIADTYMAVSSAKLNHFGFPAKVTMYDKHTYPHATTAAKTMGETEVRILTSYIGSEATTEMMDLNSSILTHKQAVKKILTADKPMAIDKVIDRRLVPYGNTKALQLFKHMIKTEGWDIKYVEEKI